MKKIIILGVIALFVGVGFQPAFADDVSMVSSRGLSNSIMENHPPYTPSNYTPCGEVTENVVNLSWDGGDPDPEDSVYYDVYFGDSFPFPKVATVGPYPWNQTRIEFGPVELECFTHYSWYICAYDEHNDSTEGYICYLVRMCENLPPRAPTIDGPVKVKLGVEYNWTFWSVDPQHDDISYYIEWGDGTSNGWTDYYPSGAVLTFSYTYEEKKPEFIRAKVKDYPYGDESNWSYFYFRGKSSNLELNNKEDCDCQTVVSDMLNNPQSKEPSKICVILESIWNWVNNTIYRIEGFIDTFKDFPKFWEFLIRLYWYIFWPLVGIGAFVYGMGQLFRCGFTWNPPLTDLQY